MMIWSFLLVLLTNNPSVIPEQETCRANEESEKVGTKVTELGSIHVVLGATSEVVKSKVQWNEWLYQNSRCRGKTRCREEGMLHVYLTSSKTSQPG